MDRARTAVVAGRCLLWAALALPAFGAGRLGLNEPRPLGQQLAGAGVLAVATALAARRPLAAFALTAALGLAAGPALFTLSYGPALAVFALLLGLREGRTAPTVLCLVAVGGAGTLRIALGGADPVPEWLVMTGTLLFGCVLPWLGGRYWRQSRELTAAGWLRVARLEEEQRLAEERARLRERARIAQDMHDSLGHELSLLALRAGVLQVAPDLPERHRAAAADLRAAAADATDRLHRVIGVLREEDDAPLPLAPAGETVEQLVTRAADSGLPVLWGTGTRAGTVAPGGVAERLLHRVAREALTNAARHAPGAPVVVEVTGDDASGATVTVTNGSATKTSSELSGGGSGLRALRAAVTAVGGTFAAGPHGEGYQVSAHVPALMPAAVASARPPSAPYTHARRRVVTALGVAAGTGAALVAVSVGWYAYTETHAVLEPAAYAGLRPGTLLADLDLPDRHVQDPPTDRAPAEPDGTDCRYYRASGELFVSVDHYRLCFDDRGRLAAKDVVPRVGVQQNSRREEFAR
ncbi:sensor histidine kinase [Streptomyces sp. PAL114]|uniref:sensor histidine kinase n=1 Tax=Streptomyces sp. PAL114 TaxID=2970893 RepID=UPI0028FD383F|nr:histidine kinase [Streptomyces sp. PAL114]MDU0301422.1 histidine kinase [Streptomyces sp. PAL114]